MQVIGPAAMGAVKSCWRWPPPTSVPKSATVAPACVTKTRVRARGWTVTSQEIDTTSPGSTRRGSLLPSSRNAMTAAVPPSNSTSLPPLRKTVKT